MMLRALAVLTGSGRCPSCGDRMVAHEAGFYVCASALCSAAANYERGFWRLWYDDRARRLPGLAGIPFDRKRKGQSTYKPEEAA